MKLPGYGNALIPKAKVADYLLSDIHPTGQHKAAFFHRFGFSAENWTTLAEALQAHTAQHEVARTLPHPEGTKYIIEGVIETPDGRNPRVRTVWLVHIGQVRARFITAYPLEG